MLIFLLLALQAPSVLQSKGIGICFPSALVLGSHGRYRKSIAELSCFMSEVSTIQKNLDCEVSEVRQPLSSSQFDSNKVALRKPQIAG
jgi:hypothetical protein